MIVHVFNASVVSGPETLVIPALPALGEPSTVVFLSETRCGDFSQEPPAYARSFGLRVEEVTVRSRWDRQAVRDLAALFERLGPRVVHAHEVKAAAYVAAAAPSPRAYRLFATNHGVRSKRRPLPQFYEWLFTHVIMRRFDRVLTVCSSDRKILIRRGVPPEKLAVHLNGIDQPKIPLAIQPDRAREIRTQWGLPARGIPPESTVLGVVGRLSPEKRHGYILEVLVCLKNPEIHLVVFGRGPLEAALKQATAAHGLEGQVHWMGYRGTVGAEMAGFDVLLSLSRYEGLPINVIEAGWAGTPVLATAVDGNLDLMPTPDFGLLFPVHAPVARVAEGLRGWLENPTRRKAAGLALQGRVESQFSRAIWLRRLRELYGP